MLEYDSKFVVTLEFELQLAVLLAGLLHAAVEVQARSIVTTLDVWSLGSEFDLIL